METIGRAVLTIAGAYFFGPVGAIVGGMLADVIFPVQLADVKGPRISELQVQRGTVGAPIPIVYGTQKIAGNVVWESDLIEEKQKDEQGGGKGGSPSQTVTTYNYFIDIRIGLCDGEEGRPSKPQGIRRIWAYGDLIYDRSPQYDGETEIEFNERLATTDQTATMMTIYDGAEDQLPSTLMESYKGVGNVPAYRGLYSVQFQHFPLNKYGKAVPQFKFEVYTGDAVEESCDGYSVGHLEPWQYMLDAGVFDPRNPLNNHLYAKSITSFDPARESYTDAMADMNGHFGSPPTALYVCSETPQIGDAAFIRGWAHSTTPNFLQPCDASNPDPSVPDPTIDRVNITINLNTIRLDAQSCRVKAGSDAYGCLGYWNELGALNEQHYFSAGQSSGFYVICGAGTNPEDSGVDPSDWNLLTGFCNPPGPGGGFGVWGAIDQQMSVRRWHEPSPCGLGSTDIPGSDNFCINADGVVTRKKTWTRVAGTFKSLRPYIDSGELGGAVTSYPVDPCLSPGDPDYSNQAFWEAAFAESLADPTIYPPMDPTWVYGVDYPTARTSHATNFGSNTPVWQSSCTALAIDPECIPMADIVADICDRAGLAADQYDVTGLTSCVMGYTVTRQMSARDALTPLRMFGLWDCVESSGVLKFVERGGAIVDTLETWELGVADADASRDPPSVVEVQRTQEKDLPRRVRLHYMDIDAQHEPGEQAASRLSTEATNELDIEIAISMTADVAAQLAEVLLYDFWTSRNAYQFTVDNSKSRLEPADVIEIPVDGETERVRIVAGERAIGGIIRLEAVRDDDGDYVSTAVPTEHDPSGPSGGAPRGPLCPSVMILLDIPRLRRDDDDAGYYAAIYGLCPDTWECAAVYRSSDGGVTYGRIARTDKQATVGVVEEITGYDTGGGSLDDSPLPYDANPLTVTLVSGFELTSISDAQILSGYNAAAIGAHGRWVIIQFKTATLLSGDLWELTDILWGMNGTEANIGTTLAGDDFVLLDVNLVRLAEAPENIGVERHLKVATCGLSVDDSVAQAFTTTGLSYARPVPSTVISASVLEPPTSNADGDCYLLPTDTSLGGVWASHGGEIACWSDETGGWVYGTPPAGSIIIIDDVPPGASGGGGVISNGDGTYTDAAWTPAIPPLDRDSGLNPADFYIPVYDTVDSTYKKVRGDDLSGTGGGLSDGDKGDITVSGTGTVLTIDNDVVTYAKMQNVSATSRVLGRKTTGAGDTEECTLSEVLDFIGSAAQGDILYRDSGGWARLPAGTSGRLLKTNGAGANPSWAAAGSVSGIMSYVGNVVVAGSAASTMVMSGLDLDTDSVYFLKVALKNATASASNVSLYYNSDTTAGNYDRISDTRNRAGASGGAGADDGILFQMDGNATSGNWTGTAYIHRGPVLITANATGTQGIGGSFFLFRCYHQWVTSATNVTSFTLSASVASSLDVGSRVDVWRIPSA